MKFVGSPQSLTPLFLPDQVAEGMFKTTGNHLLVKIYR